MNKAKKIQKKRKFAEKYNLKLLFDDLQIRYNDLRVINVVGTNGKGSASYFLSKQLLQTYFKVGLFVSPSFLCSNERIQINNVNITDKKISNYYSNYNKLWKKYRLTFFECWMFIMVCYFLKEKVNIAIIEAGIGGVSDCTNLFNNQQAVVITSISLDHQKLLGDTINEIIDNKIKITKNKNTPVFVSNSNKKYQTKIESYDLNIKWSNLNNEMIKPKNAIFQDNNKIENINLILEYLKYFKCKINYNLLINDLGLLGRFSILQTQPFLIIDGAHNIAAIKSLIENIKKLDLNKYILILGFSKKKNYYSILNYLIRNKINFYWTKFNHSLSVNPFDNKDQIYNKYKIKNWKKFIKNNNQNIIFSGSLYFVPLVYKYHRKHKNIK